jgi:hypothetical protein
VWWVSVACVLSSCVEPPPPLLFFSFFFPSFALRAILSRFAHTLHFLQGDIPAIKQSSKQTNKQIILGKTPQGVEGYSELVDLTATAPKGPFFNRTLRMISSYRYGMGTDLPIPLSSSNGRCLTRRRKVS